jgi:hypothetical protein
MVEATGGTEKDAGEAAASIGVVKENASRGKGENVKLEVSTFASSKWTDIFLQRQTNEILFKWLRTHLSTTSARY